MRGAIYNSSTPTKRVLMVAYLFPPVGGLGVAGSQRVLKFAKYLPSYGWQPIILTVKEGSYESYFSIDPSLLKKIPSEAVIIRTSVMRWLTSLLEFKGRVQGRHEGGATVGNSLSQNIVPAEPTVSAAPSLAVKRTAYQRLKDGITDLFEIPDEEMGWIIPGTICGLASFRQYRYDAIFATGRPWTSLMIGLLLKYLTGRPLIVDFRDPWITNPFRLQYSPLRNRLEAWLERQVIGQSTAVIANTHELRDEFIKRFPRQPAEKFMTLLNGFDAEDFDQMVRASSHPDSRVFTLTHTGFLYGKRDPRNFLEAVRLCLREGRIDRHKLRIVLMGAAELPYSLADYLRTTGLADVVHLRAHMPYRESLECLYDSDVLLLLQPGTKTQVPSKLFDYIGVGKPILSISPLDGATNGLMLQHRLGAVADPDNIHDISQALGALYKSWDCGTLDAMVDRTAIQMFDVRHVTGMLADKLATIAAT